MKNKQIRQDYGKTSLWYYEADLALLGVNMQWKVRILQRLTEPGN